MTFTPVVAVHMTSALLAVATGPIALWARLGARQRTRLHRAFGYAWVTLMIVTAVSAIFIRSTLSIAIAGFSPIHLFIPFVLFNLLAAFWALARGNIRRASDPHDQHLCWRLRRGGTFHARPGGEYWGDWLWNGVRGWI